MADRGRGRFTRPIAWLAMLIALGIAACSAPATETGPDPSGTVEVSYAGAVEWLATLDPAEAGQQVQDWARLGLAAALRMNADQLLDEFYDGSVLRDSALDGLAEQPVGPGRALFDDGALHLLVPEDDPGPERTIGELLDQRRADAGADPALVQVHTYRIDAPDRTVVLTGQPAEPVAQARAGNGWVQRRIDTPAALAEFLSRTDHLTRLETRGSEIWAQGWDWPDLSPVITPADVAVLQRGYLQPSGPPGFSLDPGPPVTAADLQAALPGLSPALIEALRSGNYAGSEFASAEQLRDAVADALFFGRPPAPGLPADRTQLWGVDQQLNGTVPYSQARYEGGLAGTEVGMTLFYTDYVAKGWTSGVGTGVPAGRVPGFVPDDLARTPPSLCPEPGGPDFQTGRLWFGQNDAAFGYGADGVSIGRQATRLFLKADAGDGAEVEPGYQFGRGLRWWDRNYRAVADYEPQYRRLDELMRWSGALEWLTLANRELPSAGAAVDPGLTFASWYAGHPELRERAPLTFVRPPSATQEAVLTVPSRAFTDCAPKEISGGVSLADAGVRFGELPGPVALPGGLSRAAPLDRTRTSVDPAGVGEITRADSGISYQLRRGPGTAEVETSGPPSQAVRIGDGRLVTDGGRAQSLQFRTDGRTIDNHQEIGNLMAGRTTASPTETGVQITVVSAHVAIFKAFLKRLLGDPTRGPTTMPEFRSWDGDVYSLDGLSVHSGPPSHAFIETLAAEGRGPGGETLRVAAGAKKTLSDKDTTSLRPTGEPVSSTPEALLGSVPAGTPIYTDSPTSLPGAVSVTVPIVLVGTRQVRENAAGPGVGQPGGGFPGAPGGPGGNPLPTEPPGSGSPGGGGGGVGGGPWWFYGFGTGPGTGPGGPVLVSVCSTTDSSTSADPSAPSTTDPSAQPAECPR